MARNDDEGMDKYGVAQEDPDMFEKQSSYECPYCGMSMRRMEKHGNVTICPSCGSAPFEKRPR